MATTTLKTRIVLASKTAAEWASDTTVILKGELAIESDTRKVKIGDGTNTFSKLAYANLTPEEVTTLISNASHSHSNKAVLDATTASFTTALLNKLNGVAEGATKTVVDSALSSTSTNPVQNKVVNSALSGKVPTTRTVNGKALTGNITLSAGDVGADASGAASSALSSAKAYSDANLNVAKSYTDTKIDAIVGEGASETLDTIGEISQAIEDHRDVTDALNAAVGNKANASDFNAHKDNTTIHITSTERTNWNSAKTHADSAHAPSTAEKNTIVTIKKNGTALTPDSSRAVNITVPTKTSELTNDSDFATTGGTVAKANQLATGRNIKISGAVTGGTTSIFNGSADVTISATAVNAAMLTLASSDTLVLNGNF